MLTTRRMHRIMG